MKRLFLLATLVLAAAGVLAASAFAASPATLVDSGFENGVDGASLASPPWGVTGSPQRREYDTARAKVGTKSAWIQ
ncbi:MAG: hypothetical protein U1E26_11215, partial [Coriobacteriia bacterium]|nr:hypothetical protein [Coriobacteriia bacterium]